MNGGRRLVVYDMDNGRQLDVFVGEFEMCHKIPIAQRLNLDPRTVPLAELLLTKLQVVHTNHKDVLDICAILLDHEVGETDERHGQRRLHRLAAGGRLGAVADQPRARSRRPARQLPALELERRQRDLIDGRLTALWERVEEQPKSLPLEEPGEDRRPQHVVRGARGDRAPDAGRGRRVTRVLVTGAHGCIGAWVVRDLVARGIDVDRRRHRQPTPTGSTLVMDGESLDRGRPRGTATSPTWRRWSS